jgi:hypothetical protein
VYFTEIILLPFGGISIRKTQPKETYDEFQIALRSMGLYLAIVLMMLPLLVYLYSFDDIYNTRIYDFSPIIVFFQINLGLIIFNALPLYPLDGGRLLRSYLVKKYNYAFATKFVKYLTYALGAVLIIIGALFGLVIVVLALLLYAGAQGKGKYDDAAEIFRFGSAEAKKLEHERYKASRYRLLRRTKELRLHAEDVLGRSRVGGLAKFWFKFRNYFDSELTKGKLTRFRQLIISLLPLVLHIINLLKLWLQTNPVRKSILFLLIGIICLTISWLLSPSYMLLFSLGYLLCFGFGAAIIYYHTRSRKLFYLTVLGCIFWIIYLCIDLFEPLIEVSYWNFLFLEGVRGCMVPLSGIMFFAAIMNSNDFFKRARAHMPLPAFIIISTLFIIGTFVLFYEIYLISAYETDLETIRFTLRYDIANLIWFFASGAILGSIIYLIYVSSIFRYGRLTTVKLATGTMVVILLLSFLTRDLFVIMLGRFSTEPGDIDLKVGLHSNNITNLDQSDFDNLFHLEVTWDNIYSTGPGITDWNDTDWQLNYSLANNIDIYFLINPRPPEWFAELHENAVMRDQWNNTFFWLDEDPRQPSSRSVWDLSFNDPEVVNAKINFTLEVLARYQNHSNIKYISIQNEPSYPVSFNHLRLASYDPVTIVAFHTWVRDLYFDDTG